MNTPTDNKAEPDFYVFGAIGVSGCRDRAIVMDDDEEIQIAARTAEGGIEVFDDQAYLLKGWCKHFGLTYFMQGFRWADLCEPYVAEMIIG